MLDELLRQKLLEEDEDGALRIVEDALLGHASEADKLVFFAANVGDHLAAASENLLSDAPPFYERAVFYNGLDAASVDALEADARKKAQALLEDVNGAGSAQQKKNRGSAEAKERFRSGIYFYRDGAAADDQEDKGHNNDA